MKKDFVLAWEVFWKEYYSLIQEAVKSLDKDAEYLKNSDITYSLYHGEYWVEFYPRYGRFEEKYYLDEVEIGVSDKPYWDAEGASYSGSTIDVKANDHCLSSETVAKEIKRLIDLLEEEADRA